jgi:hypothetical protein
MPASRSQSPHSAPVPTGLRKKYLEKENESIPVPKRALLIPSTMDSTVNSTVLPGPDIQWNPSFAAYQDRIQRLASLNTNKPTSLPEGFPQAVTDPWAWTGSDFEDESKYVLLLDKSEIEEIEHALAFFKSKTSVPSKNASA